MRRYYRPILSEGEGLPLAGGPFSFARAEVLTRAGSEGLVDAADVPDDWRERLTRPRRLLARFDQPLPLVMGILNITPDSFSDGGLYSSEHAAIAHGKALAAKEFEAAEQDIVYEGGRFSVAGTDVSMGLFDLAGKQADQRIFMDSTSAASGPSWPNGCHITEVEVDPASGQVEVVAYASVNDVGRVVNPTIVRGQLDGGAVQGIGQALQEAVVYDEQTGQLLTGSLMDYTAPRADDCPNFKTEMDQSVPSTNNPLGVKGVGELGTIGATPAVVNAVADALARAGRSDLAPRLQMPLTPARLWELMAGH